MQHLEILQDLPRLVSRYRQNQFVSIHKRLFDAKVLDSIGVPLCDSCHKSCTIDMQISWLSIIPNVIVGLQICQPCLEHGRSHPYFECYYFRPILVSVFFSTECGNTNYRQLSYHFQIQLHARFSQKQVQMIFRDLLKVS